MSADDDEMNIHDARVWSGLLGIVGLVVVGWPIAYAWHNWAEMVRFAQGLAVLVGAILGGVALVYLVGVCVYDGGRLLWTRLGPWVAYLTGDD